MVSKPADAAANAEFAFAPFATSLLLLLMLLLLVLWPDLLHKNVMLLIFSPIPICQRF